MKKIAKCIVVSGIISIFLWGTAAWPFELLYEKQGKAYYKGDDGITIEHEIAPNATTPSFLYRNVDNKVMYFRAPNGKTLEARHVGAALSLSSVPEYDWWHGCSPTSAGMMMGYYDINGYAGLYYQRLVPRGPAELSTFSAGTYRANKAIASSQHVAGYYTGYLNSGDDPCDGNLVTCHGGGNCLADFMGTSQDMNWLFPACNGVIAQPVNSDGGTLFWNYTDGTALTSADIYIFGSCFWETSGMYGVGEYVQYRGYSFSSLYNRVIDEQRIDGTGGFTYANFKNEIDSGRPVLLHLDGHSMLAYGYSDPSTVYVRDTWNPGIHTMTWNGTYGGMQHYAMTCFTPSGGSIVPDDLVANVSPMIYLLIGQ